MIPFILRSSGFYPFYLWTYLKIPTHHLIQVKYQQQYLIHLQIYL